jgi:hypothetical protein
MSDINTESQTYDAQQMTEEIATGDREAPKVDVSADYEAAQQFSTSSIDQSEEGAKAAEEATAPQFEMPEPEETEFKAEPTGDPNEFLDMAKEVSPHAGTTGNVDDDLIQKAIELGQPNA